MEVDVIKKKRFAKCYEYDIKIDLFAIFKQNMNYYHVFA